MDNSKNKFLKNLEHKEDSIWGNVYDYGKQKQEKILREEYANNKKYGDYLSEIKHHHSIPVMDSEVKKFLNLIPKNGVILDIGGCWGWHWRNLNNVRPDIKIIILDLIRENLLHAKKLLNELIDNQQIFLIHGNATDLKFEDKIFDGVWSVQTTQHIPNFFNVCKEIHRVLKPKGIYWDYSLNNAKFTRLIYRLFKKNYHLDGELKGFYFLRRVNKEIFSTLKDIFNQNFEIRYSEILFSPELHLPIGGNHKSIFGFIDSKLTGNGIIRSLIARQCSFHIKK